MPDGENLLDLVPVLIWRAGRDGRLVYFNQAWTDFTGCDSRRRGRRRWHAYLHPAEAETAIAAIDRCLRDRKPFRLEFRLRRHDGAWRWMTCCGSPRTAPGGDFEGFVGSCMDVTDLKEAETQRLRDADEKHAVMQELHHRVKNNAQVFASLLSVQASRAAEPAVKTALRAAAARAGAMAAAQQQIWDAGSSARFDLVALVRRLVRALPASPVEIAVAAPPSLHAPLATAVPLGLIVHELLTNAVAHAYPSGTIGRVRVAIERHDGEMLLRVADDGIGMPPGATLETKPRAGLTIVRSLARQLDACLILAPDGDAHGEYACHGEGGTVVTLRIPMPA